MEEKNAGFVVLDTGDTILSRMVRKGLTRWYLPKTGGK